MQAEAREKNITMDNEESGLREAEKKLLVDLIRSLREIRYGHVQITVHDSAVTQIDKTEKMRIQRSTSYRTRGGDNGKR